MRYLLLALALVACGKPAAPKKYGSFVGPGFVHQDRDTLATLGNSAVAGDVAQYDGTKWNATAAGSTMTGNAIIGTTTANTLTVNAAATFNVDSTHPLTISAPPASNLATIALSGGPSTTTATIYNDGSLHFAAESTTGNAVSFSAGDVVFRATANGADEFVLSGGKLYLGDKTGPSISPGAGAPTGACTTGSLYVRTDGGASTTLYVCQAATWAAK